MERTSQLGINQENFYKLKIPIPSIDKQKGIVEYCEYNDILIKKLEKEIENNKKQAQQFITSIVKTQVQIEQQDDMSSVNNEQFGEVQYEITHTKK